MLFPADALRSGAHGIMQVIFITPRTGVGLQFHRKLPTSLTQCELAVALQLPCSITSIVSRTMHLRNNTLLL